VRRVLLLTVMIAGCSKPEPAEKAPPPVTAAAPRFTWPVADGWRKETIPFPLEFAPDIDHTGVEELRFAPGFFDPAAPGYWTYAFVWVVTDDGDLTMAALSAELLAYFRGLTAAVARGKTGLPPLDPARIQVRVGEDGRGSATTFDAFGDGRQVDLELTVRVMPCGTGRAVLVAAARTGQPEMRRAVDQVAASFRCGG
jgi:hypothetical protein